MRSSLLGGQNLIAEGGYGSLSASSLGLVTGGDNTNALQRAIDSDPVVTLPAGVVRVDGELTMAPGQWLRGQGDGLTTLDLTNSTGWGITVDGSPDSGADLLLGGGVERMRIIGGTATDGAISVSDTSHFSVHQCRIENFTTGSAIRARNRAQWTEDLELTYNMIRNSAVHYEFAIDDDSDPAHTSFANCRIVGSTDALEAPGECFLRAVGKSNIYANYFQVKGNIEASGASPKVVLFDLGAAAKISDGYDFIFFELQADHPYIRHQLAAGASITGTGYSRCAPSSTMSDDMDSLVPIDTLASGATCYIGVNGEYCPGTTGPAKLCTSFTVRARKFIASNATYAIAYLPSGTTRLVCRYTGTNVIHMMTLLVTTYQFSDASSDSSVIQVLNDTAFNGTTAFNRSSLPHLVFTATTKAPVLRVVINGAVSDGVLTVLATAESELSTGYAAGAGSYGTAIPLFLFPTGLSVGSIITTATLVT